jgi:hypothetical protein
MLAEKFQHVIQKSDSGRDLIHAGAVDPQIALNLRLLRIAFYVRFSHAT